MKGTTAQRPVELDELLFWDEHDPEEFDDGPAEEIILAIKPQRKKAVTLRLEPSLIRTLKEVAGAHGMGYQTLARQLIKLSLSQLRKAGRRVG